MEKTSPFWDSRWQPAQQRFSCLKRLVTMITLILEALFLFAVCIAKYSCFILRNCIYSACITSLHAGNVALLERELYQSLLLCGNHCSVSIFAAWGWHCHMLHVIDVPEFLRVPVNLLLYTTVSIYLGTNGKIFLCEVQLKIG